MRANYHRWGTWSFSFYSSGFSSQSSHCPEVVYVPRCIIHTRHSYCIFKDILDSNEKSREETNKDCELMFDACMCLCYFQPLVVALPQWLLLATFMNPCVGSTYIYACRSMCMNIILLCVHEVYHALCLLWSLSPCRRFELPISPLPRGALLIHSLSAHGKEKKPLSPTWLSTMSKTKCLHQDLQSALCLLL